MSEEGQGPQELELLTVPDAARELGVPRNEALEAIGEKRLPSVEKYGLQLISRFDLDAYKQSHKQAGVQASRGTSKRMSSRLPRGRRKKRDCIEGAA